MLALACIVQVLGAGASTPVALGAERDAEAGVLYLMTLQADGEIMARDLPSLAYPGGFFVDFAAFLDAVEFPIRRERDAWVGWARTSEEAFRWTPTAAADDGAPGWRETDDGLMVTTDRLETWFDLTLEVDTRAQRLTLRSERDLPFQARRERESRRARATAGGDGAPAVQVPDQYRAFTSPMIDVTVDAAWRGDGQKTTDSQSVSVDLGMDLLGHSVVYDGSVSRSSAGSSGEIQQRLTFSRAAPTRSSAMGFGITRYAFGDVFTASRDLVSGGGAGAGFLVERRRDARADTLDAVTIVGDARPGWDVELFRNGQVVGFGVVNADGRYVFEDLQTVAGENVFIARLYGPQGQVDEHRHVVWGGGTTLAPGEDEWSVLHVDFSERFIDDDMKVGEFRPADRLTDLRWEHGFTEWLQAGVGQSWASVASREDPGRFESAAYTSLFARARVARGVFFAEAVAEHGGGLAWSLRYLTTLRGHDVDVAYRSFDDFESPLTRREAPIASLAQVTVHGPLSWGGLEHYTLRASWRERLDAASELRVFSRLGGRWGAVFFSNDLEYTKVGAHDDLRGRLRVAGRWQRWNLSGLLDYTLSDGDVLRRLTATARWRVSSTFYTSWTLSHDMGPGDRTRFEALVSRRFGGFDLSFRAGIDTEEDWSVGVGVLFHVGRHDPGEGLIARDGRFLARSGRATLLPFIDENANGVRDSWEAPVAWAAYREAETSDEFPGELPLPVVAAGTPHVVETRHLRLDDPFLMPRDERYELYTHAGSDVTVDVPVLVTGDIAGYLFPPADDPMADVRGVSVELHATDGRLVATAVSEHDGYYDFQRVPAGAYDVVVRHPTRPDVVATRRMRLDPEAGFAMLEPFELGEEAIREPPVAVAAITERTPARP